MQNKIGITEKGDAALDTSWVDWVANGNAAILISKNPVVLFQKVKLLTVKPNIIVHATITGNGGTEYEPNVPEWEDAIEGLYSFLEMFGPERTVLRIDPIIPTKKMLQNSLDVYNRVKKDLGKDMCRVRISFFDSYKHVQERMEKKGVEIPYTDFNAPLKLRESIWKKMGKPEICGEVGMPVTACISERDCQILGVIPFKGRAEQRTACACLSNKYELLSKPHPCTHQCIFCYWKDIKK